MLKLSGELASVRIEGDLMIAGGGAANAVCLHHARSAGLGGFEFACAIPGTAGGGVRMNAGAYGSDWSDIVVRVRVVAAEGDAWLTPSDSGSRIGTQSSGAARSSRRSSTVSRRDHRTRSRDRARTNRAAQSDPTDEQAHVRQRLQESRARARRRPDARGVRAERARGRRRHDLADARELHRERGGATTADALALMAEARRRAATSSASSSSTKCKCSVGSRSRRKGRHRGETRHVAGGRGSRNRSRPRARAASARASFRAAPRAIASSCPASLPPAVHSSSRS